MIAGHFPCYSCEFAFGDAYGLALLELADVSGGDNYIVFPGIADYPETVNLLSGTVSGVLTILLPTCVWR